MNTPDLDNRYKGLYFEVGRLPTRLVYSTLYWRLPYELRRFLHAVLSPSSLGRIHKLRSIQPEDLNATTIKPFLSTQSIFVHVPKAAGISVGFGLYDRKTGDHRTIADYKLCFRKHEFESFFKFAFVRNPWDRLFSAYSYMKLGGRNKGDYDWSIKHLSPYNSFDEFVTGWVNEENIRLGFHFRPQYEFLCTIGSKIEVDFIAYFEHIANDYEYIRNKIGTGKTLTTMNKTAGMKKDYRLYYNKTTREIVGNVYREDIQLFGYNFEGTSLEDQLTKRHAP